MESNGVQQAAVPHTDQQCQTEVQVRVHVAEPAEPSRSGQAVAEEGEEMDSRLEQMLREDIPMSSHITPAALGHWGSTVLSLGPGFVSGVISQKLQDLEELRVVLGEDHPRWPSLSRSSVEGLLVLVDLASPAELLQTPAGSDGLLWEGKETTGREDRGSAPPFVPIVARRPLEEEIRLESLSVGVGVGPSSSSRVALELPRGGMGVQNGLSTSEAVSILHRVACLDIAEVARAVCRKAPKLLSERDGGGRTPLHFAARRGLHRVAVALVSEGADVLGSDAQGRSAVHYSAESGDVETLESLLSFVPRKSRKARETLSSALLDAAAVGQAERRVAACAALLEAGADPTWVEWHRLGGGRSRAVAEGCVDKGEGVKGRRGVSVPSGRGVGGGRQGQRQIDALKEKEKERGRTGVSSFHVAASLGHSDVCAMLLEAAPHCADLMRGPSQQSRKPGGTGRRPGSSRPAGAAPGSVKRTPVVVARGGRLRDARGEEGAPGTAGRMRSSPVGDTRLVSNGRSSYLGERGARAVRRKGPTVRRRVTGGPGSLLTHAGAGGPSAAFGFGGSLFEESRAVLTDGLEGGGAVWSPSRSPPENSHWGHSGSGSAPARGPLRASLSSSSPFAEKKAEAEGEGPLWSPQKGMPQMTPTRQEGNGGKGNDSTRLGTIGGTDRSVRVPPQSETTIRAPQDTWTPTRPFSSLRLQAEAETGGEKGGNGELREIPVDSHNASADELPAEVEEMLRNVNRHPSPPEASASHVEAVSLGRAGQRGAQEGGRTKMGARLQLGRAEGRSRPVPVSAFHPPSRILAVPQEAGHPSRFPSNAPEREREKGGSRMASTAAVSRLRSVPPACRLGRQQPEQEREREKGPGRPIGEGEPCRAMNVGGVPASAAAGGGTVEVFEPAVLRKGQDFVDLVVRVVDRERAILSFIVLVESAAQTAKPATKVFFDRSPLQLSVDDVIFRVMASREATPLSDRTQAPDSDRPARSLPAQGSGTGERGQGSVAGRSKEPQVGKEPSMPREPRRRPPWGGGALPPVFRPGDICVFSVAAVCDARLAKPPSLSVNGKTAGARGGWLRPGSAKVTHVGPSTFTVRSPHSVDVRIPKRPYAVASVPPPAPHFTGFSVL
uniref:Uncharacterized protein n=1 Tax=Chromera velia CCMP2878 TaxID=1169474 RepID=A0A0G4G3Z0_9ALVE|eukprot:Cvel_20002.t1-p1 / transcript=Cvel_20002.t1 / gene=Cvel_20002 / organism=Chromera_velia_CCMP2878 / gene_product=hypothetical protein / transcript_product=hypothetical protein / location=Cvel_scaffold1763:15274-21574(-) / protein_length=1121 / sequence_SO=supercontig / SO=protein_coding / is_pseudo=false